jgi:NDP-sugar pyrophosphorylase family protein
MNYIDYGLLAFRRQLFANASSEISDLAVLLHQLSLDDQLAGFEVSERFYEVGSAAGLLELDRYLADREPVRA